MTESSSTSAVLAPVHNESKNYRFSTEASSTSVDLFGIRQAARHIAGNEFRYNWVVRSDSKAPLE